MMMMICISLYLLFLTRICAYEPSCSTCKHFVPNKIKEDLGLCSMFQDSIYHKSKQDVIYIKNLAVHCRNNENLCGKYGALHEEIEEKHDCCDSCCCDNCCCDDLKEEVKEEVKEDNCYKESLFNLSDELKELEKIEKDFIDVFQKMRRHNKKILYRTPEQIYKLFNKKK
jgi:hypothetical protein